MYEYLNHVTHLVLERSLTFDMTYINIDEKQQQHMVRDSHTKCREVATLTNYAKANRIRTFDNALGGLGSVGGYLVNINVNINNH